MKTTIVAIAFFMATVFSASAQEDRNKTQDKNQTRTEQNQTQTQQQNDQYVRNHTDRMARDFDLNEDQKRRLQEQNNTLYNNNRTLGQNQNLSDADRRRMQQNYNDRYDRELEGILSEDQYKKYNSSRDDYSMDTADDMNRNRNNRGGTNR